MDDETTSWFKAQPNVKDKATLETAFLLEFGTTAEKPWDRRKELQEMKQGTQPAPVFVRLVLGKAYQLYGKKSQDPLDDAHQAEVMTVLMSGFNPRSRTFMILRNVEKLDQVISAAKEAKSIDEPVTSDTLVTSVVKD